MRSDQTNILTLCSAKRLGVLCGDKRSLNPVTLVAHLLLIHFSLCIMVLKANYSQRG
jgi:hypothetical protein